MTYQKKNKNLGVTLINLIVTIVVLIILAMVFFAMITREDSYMRQAYNAKKSTDKAEAKEKVQMELTVSISRTGDTDKEELKKGIEENLKVEKEKIKEYDDGTLIFPFEIYNVEIDPNGNVTILEEGELPTMSELEESNVIAYYDVENNSGKGYFDSSATTWKDLSGNNYDMIFRNINKTSTSGWVDNSMMLDGIDDYLTINNLNISQYNDISISATYKVLSLKGSTANGLLCSSTPSPGRLFIGYGQDKQYSSNFTIPDTWMGSRTNVMELGETNNVIYTFKGKNENSKNTIYKNAENIMTNDTAMTCNWASNLLELGRSWGGLDPTYYTAHVQVYNLMIYNGSLNEYQIQKISNEENKKYKN